VHAAKTSESETRLSAAAGTTDLVTLAARAKNPAENDVENSCITGWPRGDAARHSSGFVGGDRTCEQVFDDGRGSNRLRLRQRRIHRDLLARRILRSRRRLCGGWTQHTRSAQPHSHDRIHRHSGWVCALAVCRALLDGRMAPQPRTGIALPMRWHPLAP